MSDTTWASFHLQMHEQLGVQSESLQLFYHVQGLNVRYTSERSFKPLLGEDDWTQAMSAVKRGFDLFSDPKLEVMHKVSSTSQLLPTVM